MSRKKWGKSTTKTERIIRDAVPKPETIEEINEYLAKARSVTAYDLAKRFGIRISVAKRILREKEQAGVIIPYIRESGFAVYTTPSAMEDRKAECPIMISDVLEEIASTVPETPVIDEEMEEALAAASIIGIEKPSKAARRRRAAGAKKERKDTRPEVVVEPIEAPEEAEEKPKKKATKKKTEEAEEKPKKKATKKKTEEAEEKPKKKATKKKTEEAEEKPKKKATKKKTEEAEEKPKKKATKKKTE